MPKRKTTYLNLRAKSAKLVTMGLFAAVFAVIGLLLLLHPKAATPGTNGKIVFGQSNGAVYTVNSDGSSYQLLANDGSSSYKHSPRGDKIAYRGSDGNIWVMNADGTNKIKRSSLGCVSGGPDWSSDALFVAYIYKCPADQYYYVIVFEASNGEEVGYLQSDGAVQSISLSPNGYTVAYSDASDIYAYNFQTGVTKRLTTDPAYDGDPDWSPDGNKIVFTSGRNGAYEIYSMNSDGTSQTRLTNNSYPDGFPKWSPDNTKILYYGEHADANTKYELYTMNANGTGETLLRSDNSYDLVPTSWQPTNVVPQVYRFWSSVYNHHFYTASYDEAVYVMDNNPNWNYEQAAYRANDANNCSGKQPVYRFWSDAYFSHFYTIDANEKAYIQSHYPSNVWRYESVAFCANTTKVAGTKPLYRFWSNKYHGHFFTTDEQEKQQVIDLYDDNVWKYEGVAYYVQ